MSKITIAQKIPYTSTVHGTTLSDDYHWMRDPNWPKVSNKKVISYLKAENKYAEAFFKPLKKEIDKVLQRNNRTNKAK